MLRNGKKDENELLIRTTSGIHDLLSAVVGILTSKNLDSTANYADFIVSEHRASSMCKREQSPGKTDDKQLHLGALCFRTNSNQMLDAGKNIKE